MCFSFSFLSELLCERVVYEALVSIDIYVPLHLSFSLLSSRWKTVVKYVYSKRLSHKDRLDWNLLTFAVPSSLPDDIDSYVIEQWNNACYYTLRSYNGLEQVSFLLERTFGKIFSFALCCNNVDILSRCKGHLRYFAIGCVDLSINFYRTLWANRLFWESDNIFFDFADIFSERIEVLNWMWGIINEPEQKVLRERLERNSFRSLISSVVFKSYGMDEQTRKNDDFLIFNWWKEHFSCLQKEHDAWLERIDWPHNLRSFECMKAFFSVVRLTERQILGALPAILNNLHSFDHIDQIFSWIMEKYKLRIGDLQQIMLNKVGERRYDDSFALLPLKYFHRRGLIDVCNKDIVLAAIYKRITNAERGFHRVIPFLCKISHVKPDKRRMITLLIERPRSPIELSTDEANNALLLLQWIEKRYGLSRQDICLSRDQESRHKNNVVTKWLDKKFPRWENFSTILPKPTTYPP